MLLCCIAAVVSTTSLSVFSPACSLVTVVKTRIHARHGNQTCWVLIFSSFVFNDEAEMPPILRRGCLMMPVSCSSEMGHAWNTGRLNLVTLAPPIEQYLGDFRIRLTLLVLVQVLFVSSHARRVLCPFCTPLKSRTRSWPRWLNCFVLGHMGRALAVGWGHSRRAGPRSGKLSPVHPPRRS